MDRAGPALGDAAPKLGARHLQFVTKDPQERGVGFGFDLKGFAVNFERDRHTRSSP
jgi:hypothetical protein